MTEFPRLGVGPCESGLGRALVALQAGSRCKATPPHCSSPLLFVESPDEWGVQG